MYHKLLFWICSRSIDSRYLKTVNVDSRYRLYRIRTFDCQRIVVVFEPLSPNSIHQRRRMGVRFRRAFKRVCAAANSAPWSPTDIRVEHQANLVSIDSDRQHVLAGLVELLLLHYFSGLFCVELFAKNHDIFDADCADSADIFI